MMNDKNIVYLFKIQYQVKMRVWGWWYLCSTILHKLLFYSYGEVLGDGEAVPLVIDDEDVACEGNALLVAVLVEVGGVESPLEGHGVLGEDLRPVLGGKGEPLAVHFYLCTRDVEDDAMIITLLQGDGLAELNVSRQACGYQVFQEETSRIHELEWLGFRLTIHIVICISISI